MAWSSRELYATPLGVVEIRANRVGLASKALGVEPRILGSAEAPGLEASEVLYLFRGARTGWLLVREGSVVFRHEDAESFGASLRSFVLGRLALGLPTHALFLGHWNDETKTLRVETGDPASTDDGRILITEDGAILPSLVRSSSSLQTLELSRLEGAHLELCRSGAPPVTRTRIDPETALLSLLGASKSLGGGTASGLDLVWRVASLARAVTTEFPVEVLSELRLDSPRGSLPSRVGHAMGCESVQWVDLNGSELKPRTTPGLLLRRVSDRWLACGGDGQAAQLIDDQARAVLELLDGETSLGEIVDAALELFGQERKEVEHRLHALVEAFVAGGIASIDVTTSAGSSHTIQEGTA